MSENLDKLNILIISGVHGNEQSAIFRYEAKKIF